MTTNPQTPQQSWDPTQPPAPPVPSPKQPSWFRRHKILTTLLALVVLGVAIKVGGGDSGAPADSPAASAPSVKAPAKSAAAPAKTTPKIGTPVRDGKFEFTVTKVEPGVAAVGNDVLGEKAQGQFVLVHVTVENIGTESQALSDGAQKVRDAKGREFTADSAAAMYLKDNQVLYNEINPGNTVKGTLVFDMPKDTKPVSIELHDSLFSGGATVALS